MQLSLSHLDRNKLVSNLKKDLVLIIQKRDLLETELVSVQYRIGFEQKNPILFEQNHFTELDEDFSLQF